MLLVMHLDAALLEVLHCAQSTGLTLLINKGASALTHGKRSEAHLVCSCYVWAEAGNDV